MFLSGLIKLRDLPGNYWNADTLFILTESHAKAEKLARIAEAEDWAADEVHVYHNAEEIGRALGAWGEEYGLLSLWWD